MSSIALRHLAGAVLVLLAGCGGGGGGSSSDGSPSVQPAGQPLAITTTNYSSVASEGASNVDQFAGSGEGAATLLGAETGSAGSTARRLMKVWRTWQAAGPAPAVLSGAVITQSVNCSVSGSISGSLNDLNGSQDIDAAGESVTLTFNSCNDGAGETYSGRVLFAINTTIQGNPASNVFSLNVTLAMNNFRAADATSDLVANGSLTIVATSTSAGNSSIAITSPAFGASYTAGGATRSFALHDVNVNLVEVNNASTLTYAATVTSSSFGGRSVDYRTTTPFRYAPFAIYPSSGVAVATGSNGGRSVLTAVNANQVNIECDVNGDAVPETSTTRNWIDFL